MPHPPRLMLGDCLDMMAEIPTGSVDMVLTDPPYFRVKSEAWDRQWADPARFLAWLDRCAEQWARVLKPNGSLYCFASVKMAARVECLLSQRLNVLNNIRWCKPRGRHLGANKSVLRSYFSASEAIIFAEHYGADSQALGVAGYGAKCEELRGFVFEPLRAYICAEYERAGMLNGAGMAATNAACGVSAMARRHYFTRSQWALPTAKHYAAMRAMLNKSGGEYLRREYEDLRREYEDLRREYEDLRRPFSVTPDVQYVDTWTFLDVQTYKGKHPCEKPLDLLRHMISASTKPEATVLDCFMGSGSTGIACAELGRNFIGIEKDRDYFNAAAAKIAAARPDLPRPTTLTEDAEPAAPPIDEAPLFKLLFAV